MILLLNIHVPGYPYIVAYTVVTLGINKYLCTVMGLKWILDAAPLRIAFKSHILFTTATSVYEYINILAYQLLAIYDSQSLANKYSPI